eukprot:141933_1
MSRRKIGKNTNQNKHKLSWQDEIIASNIAFRLCKCLNLPPLTVSDPRLSTAVCNKVCTHINIRTLRKLQKLEAKFGDGAIIISFKSPEDVIRSRLNIPREIQAYFYLHLLHLSWIVGDNGLYFLTNEIMHMMNIKCKKTESKQFQIIVLVYDEVTNTENHNIFWRFINLSDQMMQFVGLLAPKISDTCVLKITSRDLQPFFQDRNINIVFQIMQNRVLNMHSITSLKSFIDNFVPINMLYIYTTAHVITKQYYMDDLLIQDFIEILENLIQQNENRFARMVSVIFKTYQSNKELLYCALSQFPFILDSIWVIMDIIGSGTFVAMFQAYTQSVVNTEKCNALYTLIRKMQPKYCSIVKERRTGVTNLKNLNYVKVVNKRDTVILNVKSETG